MKIHPIVFVFIVTALFGCESGAMRHTAGFKPDVRLLNYTQELVLPVDTLSLLNQDLLEKIYSDTLHREIDTIKYIDDKIYVSCLRVATGCGAYTGDIRFIDDTIETDMHLISDEVCSEVDGWRVTYLIENKSRKKYHIRKNR